MVRIARVVVPDVPHHVTQRGNRRQRVFFQEQDYVTYLELLAAGCAKEGVEIWAYCLMPNHVHLVAVPRRLESLRLAIGEAHRRYTRIVNAREDWKGYLWQGRFSSFPMDEGYLLAAARYIELNPVRARLVEHAWDYRWSSVHAHLSGEDDKLVRAQPLLERVDDWRAFLRKSDEAADGDLRKHENTGRPAGSKGFIERLSSELGRDLIPKRRGRKKKADLV